MPDPYERHARTRDLSGAWGPNPGRRQARMAAAAEPVVKRPPGKKDPDLCKALHWAPHKPVLRIREFSWKKPLKCAWRNFWSRDVPEWDCNHEEVCSGCGKVLRITVGAAGCPDFHEITETEQQALDTEIELWRVRRAARRRPVIDGPQGYRKKK